jgi:tRNA(Ile)-lysidine synthase
LPVAAPGVTALPGSAWVLRVEAGHWSPAEAQANAEPWQAFIGWDSTELGGLSLRTRRPGDRFQPQGMGGAEPKLSDFMIGQKVPRPWRERLPLLARGDEILWVCGWRVSEAAAVRPETAGVLRLSFERVH